MSSHATNIGDALRISPLASDSSNGVHALGDRWCCGSSCNDAAMRSLVLSRLALTQTQRDFDRDG
jgi:hypothetical protein